MHTRFGVTARSRRSRGAVPDSLARAPVSWTPGMCYDVPSMSWAAATARCPPRRSPSRQGSASPPKAASCLQAWRRPQRRRQGTPPRDGHARCRACASAAPPLRPAAARGAPAREGVEDGARAHAKVISGAPHGCSCRPAAPLERLQVLAGQGCGRGARRAGRGWARRGGAQRASAPLMAVAAAAAGVARGSRLWRRARRVTSVGGMVASCRRRARCASRGRTHEAAGPPWRGIWALCLRHGGRCGARALPHGCARGGRGGYGDYSYNDMMDPSHSLARATSYVLEARTRTNRLAPYSW